MLNGVPRILIVRLSAIGDVVRVLPALHALRAGFPHAQIDWAVERKAAAVVEEHPELDRVLVFDRAEEWRTSWKRFWEYCRNVRRSHYDIVVDFHGILKSGLLAGLSGAPERYGFAPPRGQEGSYLAANRRVRLNGQVLNRIDENLQLAGKLAPVTDADDECPIFVPADVRTEIEEYFEGTFDGGKICVALHVPVDRPEKAWPPGYFGELADMLLGDGRFEVLLTWGPGQREAVEEALRYSKRSPAVAPEMESLKHYAWLVRCAGLYCGGDTGPMHIAAAMGTPVVAIFGGTDPRRHAPVRVAHEVLGWSETGAESARKKLSAAERLRSVTPEMVYDACVRVAGQPS